LNVGAEIIFSKQLEEIKQASNPGGFDYKRYCLFQGITHQVFLKKREFVVLRDRQPTILAKILFPIRRKVLFILRKYIPGAKEQGLAEALLIGYKDDLDKNLVQSYTNTGVVHVIAISGLHLGLIYWLLVRLFGPLRKKKISKWLSPIMIIGAVAGLTGLPVIPVLRLQ
jgi:competence protein ComEC